MDRENRMLEARLLQARGRTQLEIAKLLGVCERAVRNYMKQLPRARKRPKRTSKLDPFKPVNLEQLEKNPSYGGELIFDRIARVGYTGKKTVMKEFRAKERRRIESTAVLRFEAGPDSRPRSTGTDEASNASRPMSSSSTTTPPQKLLGPRKSGYTTSGPICISPLNSIHLPSRT